jgi:hypothetical protein
VEVVAMVSNPHSRVVGTSGINSMKKNQKDCPVLAAPNTSRVHRVHHVKFAGGYSGDLTGGW